MTSTLERIDVAPVSVRREVGERLWVLIVAGILTGALVAGVGSRLTMLVLRLTSPDTVIGVTSDDGIDFRFLKPTWLAIGLFVALPAVFGVAIAAVVDRVAAIGAPRGWRGWILAIVL